MNIAIVGFDTEGRASYDYFAARGHNITIHDQNPAVAVPAGVPSVLGEQYLDNLDRYDLIVRTPGLQPRLILEKNPETAPKITTHINEFLRVCPTPHVIGVTGTKGKGTTSTLITKMLEANKHEAYLGGNIGVPPLTFLDKLKTDSWVVLELSSFQLIDLKRSPLIGVCLMVVPEHLNWHADMEEYLTAKEQLFAHQTVEDIAIYLAGNDNSYRIASAGLGQMVPYYEAPGAHIEDEAIVIDGSVICHTSEMGLLGAHNWQNACAAVTALWQAGFNDPDPLRAVLTTFTGLPHRLEPVRELDGIRYYDDSFGTTPETAMVAVQAFDTPKVVILGGSDKGASFDELAAVIAGSNVRKALLIGERAAAIQVALEAAGFSDFMPGGQNMTEIVNNARNASQPGDVVVLSPACASFDMFASYKDRGDQFKQAVQALA